MYDKEICPSCRYLIKTTDNKFICLKQIGTDEKWTPKEIIIPRNMFVSSLDCEFITCGDFKGWKK